MEHLRADDERIRFRISASVDWDSHPTKQIRDALVDLDSGIDEYRTSNRAMWPDTQLRGVEFEDTEPFISGSITPDEIKFTVPESVALADGHARLREWFDEAGFNLPTLGTFTVNTVAFEADEGWAITTDPSKCEERGMLGLCNVDVNGTRVEYAADIVAGAYITFPEDDVSVDNVADVTEAFVSKDILLIGDADEVDRDGSPDWC